MPFSLDDLASRFPFLYHLTAIDNLPEIRRLQRLESASALLRDAGLDNLAQVRRKVALPLNANGRKAVLRDQAPLHAGHIDFAEGWDMACLVSSLNRRVFFWPGIDEGPNDYGQRHFRRYADENPAILRVRLRDLLTANKDRTPLFCRYNSGSPRTTQAKKSPRGPDTFLPCDKFPLSLNRVVEVTFEEAIDLPIQAMEVRRYQNAAWHPLIECEW